MRAIFLIGSLFRDSYPLRLLEGFSMSIELRHEPRDSISSLCYGPNHAKNVLACTAWDKVNDPPR